MAIDPRAIWELVRALRSTPKSTKGTVTGTVVKVRNDKLWVRLDGGEGDTPTESTTADAKVGDRVVVSVENGVARIDGSVSSPSVGMREVKETTNKVSERVDDLGGSLTDVVDQMGQMADVVREAGEIAQATGQHHWARSEDVHGDGAGTGAFVTEDTKDEFLEAAENGWADYGDGPDQKLYHNVLINSLGMLIRSAVNNLVSISKSAIAFYDGLGNTSANILATFGASGTQIGKSNESHLVMDGYGIEMVDRDNRKFFGVTDMRDSGYTYPQTVIAELTTGVSGKTSWSHYQRNAVSITSVYVSTKSTQTEWSPYEEVTYEFDDDSKEVSFTTEPASSVRVKLSYVGYYDGESKSYVFGKEGYYSSGKAPGPFSVSEGYANEACGFAAHAEGGLLEGNVLYSTNASGPCSHAEGASTVSSGRASHAEGIMTHAGGKSSHAQNYLTTAAYDHQTAIGIHNENRQENAFEIGNGTEAVASNAFEVDWDGNVTCGGVVVSGPATYGYLAGKFTYGRLAGR